MSVNDTTIRVKIGSVEIEATGPSGWVEVIIAKTIRQIKRLGLNQLPKGEHNES